MYGGGLCVCVWPCVHVYMGGICVCMEGGVICVCVAVCACVYGWDLCVYGGGGGYLCVCVCVWKDTLIEVCLSTCCPDNMNPPIKLAAIVTDYRST